MTRRRKRRIKKFVTTVAVLAAGVAGLWLTYDGVGDHNNSLAKRWGSPYRATIVTRSPVRTISIMDSDGVHTDDFRSYTLKLTRANSESSTAKLLMSPKKHVGEKLKLWRDGKGNLTDDLSHVSPNERKAISLMIAVGAGFGVGLLTSLLMDIILALISAGIWAYGLYARRYASSHTN